MDIKINKDSVIVFDLDDTLYNESEYLRSAYIEIAKKLAPKNWKPLFAKLYSFYRCGLDAFEHITETYGISKTELLNIYRNHSPTIYPFEGVMKTFLHIKENKGRVCIITDGRKVTQQGKIKALGLLNYIDTIIISEETGFEKPDEHNFKMIEETYVNGHYWYIADNFRKDFISPNNMGWNTVGLIDNGLNVHYDSHLYFNTKTLPKNFVLSFNEIHIL
ncbi:hypothetical protein LCGC14_1047360 [marine sediment metagenome]|uniref:HAD family hydrolase n=2 Tax=root TaxID=1 RepID=A0A831QT61_9FLAO|nr:HAD family hydrolase [Pricia sp.]HEA22221.1 HAD family hydrolase [Pricia antarctica]